MRACFPVLDVLKCLQTLPELLNPLVYLRWAKVLAALLPGGGGGCQPLSPAQIPPGSLATRSEEIEVGAGCHASKSSATHHRPDQSF